MRLVRWFAVSLCLAAPALAVAAPDPFADFRIPAHRTWSGTADLALSAGRDHYPGTRNSQATGNGRVSLSRGWDSDVLRYSYGVTAGGGLSRNRRTGTFSTPSQESEQLDRYQGAGESWTLQGSLRSFPWAVPLGIDLGGTGAGSYQQSWSESESDGWVDYAPPRVDRYRFTRDSRHDYLYSWTYALTVGLGRVRDATAVYSVHVLESRLLASGAAERRLTAGARERLAGVLYAQGAVSSAHDHPVRYLWREVERILREDGALAGPTLDAYSLMRALEGVEPRGTIARSRGWYAGPTLQGMHRHQISRIEVHSISETRVADTLTFASDYRGAARHVDSWDEVYAGASAEYHRPLGWAWQLDLASSVTGPVRPGQHGLSASSSASVRWTIADRWDADGRLSHSRYYFREDGDVPSWSRDGWRASYSTSIGYYLEDRTRLSLSLGESQSRSSEYGDPGFTRSTAFRLGLTFRFLGVAEAPGLFETMRLMD